MGHFKTYLTERRSHPDLNPKIEIKKQLKKHLDKYVLVSYSSVPKLGINPFSGFSTPIGIYGYILNVIFDDISSDGSYDNFAGDRRWLNVYKPKNPSKLFSASGYDNGQYVKDIEKLYQLYEKDNPNLEVIITIGSEEAKQIPNLFASKMWNITRNLASQIANDKSQKAAIAWTSVLMSLGYEGAIDPLGYGLIHPNEPYQGVIFKLADLKMLDRFDLNIQAVSNKQYRDVTVNKHTTHRLDKQQIKWLYTWDDILLSTISPYPSGTYFKDIRGKLYIEIEHDMPIKSVPSKSIQKTVPTKPDLENLYYRFSEMSYLEMVTTFAMNSWVFGKVLEGLWYIKKNKLGSVFVDAFVDAINKNAHMVKTGETRSVYNKYKTKLGLK